MKFVRLLAISAVLAAGIAPARASAGLTLSPDPLAFGTVTVGQAEVRTVRAVNATGAQVKATAVSTKGLQVLSTSCTAGLLLDPGQECSVVVQWKPKVAGALAGSVTVTADTGVSLVTATGKAVAPLRLTVKAHSKTLRIRQRTQLIRSIRTNGRVTGAQVWCSYRGKRLPEAFAKRVCGLRVTGSGKKLRAQVRPLCTEDLTLRSQVAARNGSSRELWKRTWRVFVRPHAGGHPNVPICATMGERFG